MDRKCEECKWFVDDEDVSCTHPRAVFGDSLCERMGDILYGPGPCGPTGKLFEPKDKQEEK